MERPLCARTPFDKTDIFLPRQTSPGQDLGEGVRPKEKQGMSASSFSGPSSLGAAVAPSRDRPLAAIFWGGLLAGIFDITQAFVGFGLLGAKPFRILQHI